MIIERIRLENFRNYESQLVEFSPGINVIAGENAQGKTNLLEGIFYLSCGHGFRTRLDKELTRFGAGSARVTGEVFSHERLQTIDITFGPGMKKRALCNDVKTAMSELSNVLRVVLFSPDDLNMIKAGAKERRQFMDTAISQLRPNYALLISKYAKLYEHKRRILNDWREKPSLLDTLDSFSDGLNRCSSQIIRYRAAYVKRLSEKAAQIYGEFSGSETLDIEYKTVSTVPDPFMPAQELYEYICAHQKDHRDAEIATGNILTGIHKDDFEIEISGARARSFASQGQARTAALSLKMAEREISREDTGENPVLLLDDVLSELDMKRQEYVLNRIGGGQTLITCCEDEQIKRRTGGRVLTVSGGRVDMT